MRLLSAGISLIDPSFYTGYSKELWGPSSGYKLSRWVSNPLLVDSIVGRAELGIKPYRRSIAEYRSRRLANLAIRADGILAAAEVLDSPEVRKTKSGLAILKFAEVLASHIK